MYIITNGKIFGLFFLIAPQNLTIEGPDELNTDSDAIFTCKTKATYKTSVDILFKLDSYETDYFADLVAAGYVEIQETPTVTNDVEFSRTITIKPELLWNQCHIGRTLTIECSVEENCHGVKIYNSVSKVMSLAGKYSRS